MALSIFLPRMHVCLVSEQEVCKVVSRNWHRMRFPQHLDDLRAVLEVLLGALALLTIAASEGKPEYDVRP